NFDFDQARQGKATMAMAVAGAGCSSVVSSLSLEKSAFTAGTSVKGLASPLLRPPTSNRSMKVVASGVKKIKVDQPLGPSGDLTFRNGVDAGGRKPKGKGVYQFTNKYGANVDGYSPIYDTKDWSPTGDVYVGGKTGLLIWAITFSAILLGGALLVYNTSALSG
ncbi:hypothetical protein EYC93_27565, partial [Enterobacter hormaechei]|uniref:photosystem II protein PsbR n=1 Tax=Enterobacter hormaechei TaxID=158836 RepID=UPI0011ED76CA